MSSITTQRHEQIRLDMHQLREAESSQHEISKLAYELLLNRLDERHVENERISLEERAWVDSEHSANAAELAVAHEQENSKFKNSRLAMIASFDKQRDQLRAALEKKWDEEARQHTALQNSLQAELVREDQEAEQQLQQIVKRYEQDRWITCKICRYESQPVRGAACSECGFNLEFCESAEVIQARAQWQQNTVERHKVCKELVNRHKADWRLRQDALWYEFNNPASCEARLDLECDFQRQSDEYDQRWTDIQERQDDQLKRLETDQRSALEAVRQAYEHAECELSEEHQRVEMWWKLRCDEVEASLLRIDEEEQHALGDFDLRAAAATVKAESDGLAVEAEVVCGVVADHLEEEEARVEGVDVTDVDVVDEEHPTDTCHTFNEEGIVISTPRRHVHSLLQLIAQTTRPAHYPTMPHIGSARRPDFPADVPQVPVISSTGTTHTPLEMTSRLGPQSILTVPLVTPPDTVNQFDAAEAPSHIDLMGSAPDRSSSPDSGGFESDYVEI